MSGIERVLITFEATIYRKSLCSETAPESIVNLPGYHPIGSFSKISGQKNGPCIQMSKNGDDSFARAFAIPQAA
jgi:hypothetical protein